LTATSRFIPGGGGSHLASPIIWFATAPVRQVRESLTRLSRTVDRGHSMRALRSDQPPRYVLARGTTKGDSAPAEDSVESANADDRGMFRFADLAPGPITSARNPIPTPSIRF
jgi:hypothetical protein